MGVLPHVAGKEERERPLEGATHVIDQAFGLDALGNKVDEKNEDAERYEGKQDADGDRQVWHEARFLHRAHGSKDEKAVDEGGDVSAKGKLNAPVRGEVAQDARAIMGRRLRQRADGEGKDDRDNGHDGTGYDR
jgi:hypothetical protein